MWEQPVLAVAQPAPGKKRRRAAGSKRSSRRRGLVVFVVILALLLGCAVAFGIWSRVARDSRPAMGEWGDWNDEFFKGEWSYEEPDPQETAVTSIPRNGIGGDARLSLAETAGEPLSLVEIYEKNIPAIVSITALGDWGGSSGTGVVMSEDGYLITNAHVVEGAERVTVKFHDGKQHTGFLVGMDKSSDLAVLKVEATGLAPAEFGNSDHLKVGETAVAIGNPLGEELQGTMTEGIVSAVNRGVEVDGVEMTLIQTSAALNSGNSGGALINGSGQVIGITNMKMMSDYSTIEGLGFAIPTAVAKPIVDTLIVTGEVVGTPMLGITVIESEELEQGLEIHQVERKSDAWEQGLRRGDIIVEAGGQSVNSLDDLSRAKEGLEIGDTITLTVLRDGEELSFTVTLVDSNKL